MLQLKEEIPAQESKKRIHPLQFLCKNLKMNSRNYFVILFFFQTLSSTYTLLVCLYPKNVKTAEPQTGPNFVWDLT